MNIRERARDRAWSFQGREVKLRLSIKSKLCRITDLANEYTREKSRHLNRKNLRSLFGVF